MAPKLHFATMVVAALSITFSAATQAQIPEKSIAAKPSTKAVQPSPPQPAAPSLLSQPSQPANVTLASGRLTVEAHNSTLAGILDQIAHAGGMKIHGLQAGGNGNERIFGTYGPGAPRAVLNALLDGSGYNILMLGTTASGVPSELALSLRPTGGISNPAHQSAQQVREEYQADQIRPTHYAPEPQNQPPGPPPQNGPRGVRSSQQMLQELQELRQQQLEQQRQQQEQNQDNDQ